MSSVRILQKAQSVKVTSISGLPYQPSADMINEAVTEYMDAHPEAQIPDGAVSTAKIADEAVTTDKIADESVTTDKLANNVTAGYADNLVSSSYVSDSEPYLFRKTFAGVREDDEIVGGSVVWNQRTQNGNFESTTGWVGRLSTLSASGNILTLTPSSDGTSRGFYSNRGANDPLISVGHKYLLSTEVLSPVASGISLSFGGAAGAASTPQAVANQWTPCATIWTSTNATFRENYYTLVQANLTTSQQVKFRNHMTFDLTAWFGSTIADYLYSVEQATAGAGVALAKKWAGIKWYIPYDSGTLKSVSNVSAHKMVGYNQWDEEWENGRFNLTTGEKSIGNGLAIKNKIRVLPNTTYYASCGAGYGSTLILLYYDADENFVSYEIKYSLKISFTTPSNACYVNFNLQTSSAVTAYNNDICINISDPQRNGSYEPYKTHSYPLDSSLTLRGITKLVDNQLVYDGDIYKSDGTVTRRYGYRAYQSGDESLANAITDGTHTVYKLTTATTETTDPYTNPQKCYPDGTEEYIDTRDVPIPVGHNTKYMRDLKKLLEGIPDAPSASGTYVLKATVSSSGVTYAWIAG